MIEAIRVGDPEIMTLFEPSFNSALKWTNYLDQYFGPGESLSIDRVLDSGDRWHSVRFQALYIACWIYHPVEKGSYMIKLSPAQLKNATDSAAKLSSRASSHLKGSSFSAGKDFAFIKGYSELLVMIFEDYLFLKMEGHPAISWAHFKAWQEKRKTGAGATNNAQLNALAKDRPEFGIMQRGAENYSKPYEAFLKELGLKGKTLTLSDTLLALREKTRLQLGNPLTHGEVKAFLRAVPARLTGNLKDAFKDAEADLTAIVRDSFGKDVHRLSHDGVDDTGMDRIFRELRLDPQRIDRKLNKFVNGVRAKSFEEVKAINNG
ncbi:MAG TPA: hypothetical protein VIP11_21260 [Gemmatimonadaceae bacterium]